MAVPTLIRRERRNAWVYFIPAGEVVDAVTVSKTTWPDNDPLTNYTNYQFADIETVAPEILSAEEQFSVPRTSGGYGIDTEKHLQGRNLVATTAKTNSFLKALQYATPNPMVAGTAQEPNVRSQLWMEGVLLVEYRNNAGAIIEREQVWAKMFLNTPGGPDAKPETTKLEVKWEIQPAGNNTMLPVA